MLRDHILASGSRGNITLIQTEKTSILVDCGLSLRRTLQKLSSCGLSLKDIDAVVLTHSHSDHSKGLFSLSHLIPIYLTSPLFDVMNGPDLCENNCIFFRSGEAFWIKDIHVLPIPVSHDCVDPVCFIFSYQNDKICVITDLGCVDKRLISAVYGCRKILIESNYELSLLIKSSRPGFLKNRILSRKGHLSNRETGRFLADVYSARLEEVVLLHLSQECNTPTVALIEVKKQMLKKSLCLPSFQVAGVEGLPSPYQWL